jgi:hypothetical protein
MGQIIIEIPQNGVHIYRIQDTGTVKKLLSDLEQIVKKEKEEEEEDILGLWTVPEPIKRAARQ